MRNVGLLFLAALLSLILLGASPVKSIVINATEDAYVVADLNDPEDAEGLRERNLGDLDFTKAWYAWRILGEELAVGIVYLKFDLEELKGKEIESASLQLYASRVDLVVSPRLVEVRVVGNDWSEASIDFNSAPARDTDPIAFAAVYRPDFWYSWDITDSVAREKRDGAVSFAASLVVTLEELQALEGGREEQAVFASLETGANVPRLLVTFTEDDSGISGLVWITAGAAGGAIVLVAAGAFLVGRRRHRQGT